MNQPSVYTSWFLTDVRNPWCFFSQGLKGKRKGQKGKGKSVCSDSGGVRHRWTSMRSLLDLPQKLRSIYYT